MGAINTDLPNILYRVLVARCAATAAAGLFLTLVFMSGTVVAQQDHRSINGRGTHPANPEWGATMTLMERICPPVYEDNLTRKPVQSSRKLPREISNLLCTQNVPHIPNELGLSDFVWAWGQFISHDISFANNNPTINMPTGVPPCDPSLDPNCLGRKFIQMMPTAGDTLNGLYQHHNFVTAYIDAGLLYSDSPMVRAWIRLGKDGMLKSSEDGYLPYNTLDGTSKTERDNRAPLMEVGAYPNIHFVSGDRRVNVQSTLLALHTLLFREHNRLCKAFKEEQPQLTDDELFYKAKLHVEALLQSITYYEFLPVVGIQLPQYEGFKPEVNPTVFNEFSAAAFRWHSLISESIPRLDEYGDSSSFKTYSLFDAFSDLQLIVKEGGIESLFRGIAAHPAQKMDLMVTDVMRNQLFARKEVGGGDIATVNVNRGRDRGLPGINALRLCLGMKPFESFLELTKDEEIAQRLETAYSHIDSTELWIGMLSEAHEPGHLLGSTMEEIMKRQFIKLRDGDPLFFENSSLFSADEKAAIRKTRLSDVIKRNTNIKHIQSNIFRLEPALYQLLTKGSTEVLASTQGFVGQDQIGVLVKNISEEKELKVEVILKGGNGRVVSSLRRTVTSDKDKILIPLDSSFSNGTLTVTINGKTASGPVSRIHSNNKEL